MRCFRNPESALSLRDDRWEQIEEDPAANRTVMDANRERRYWHLIRDR
jgi:hypothetical protein